jgi:Mrp family chromosome partitioning ATPase
MPTTDEVMQALRRVIDPEIGRNLVDLHMIHDLKIGTKGKVGFTIALTVPACPLRDQMANDARAAVKALDGVKQVEIQFRPMTESERKAAFALGQAPSLPKLNNLNQVRQVIAVMSGKGGVGKSTVTAGLAVKLRRQGQKVGILDADVTGPSIPRLFGLSSGGLRGGQQGMLPAATHNGIKVVSANLLLKDELTPIIWRGPMIAGAIKQFWTDALWGKLDTMLVDLPPGTSDAAISVIQNLPLAGAILVTTPQELAAMVVIKAVSMLKEMKVPILGVIENMSYFRCPESGQEHAIFGPSHAEDIASVAGVPVWARLPIDPQVTALCDGGRAEELDWPELETLAIKIKDRIVSG